MTQTFVTVIRTPLLGSFLTMSSIIRQTSKHLFNCSRIEVNNISRLFKGRMETDTLVVHPAYWRKGHGTSLNKWHTELADLDGVGLGVVASKMGRKLFTHVGFKEAAQINVPGYENHPKPLEVWIGLRNLSETQPKAEL